MHECLRGLYGGPTSSRVRKPLNFARGTCKLPRRPRTQGFVCFTAGPNRDERLGLGPRRGLTKEEVLNMQLQSIQMNNMPYSNHGIEVVYRFTNFDPFERTTFFGRRLDLGQFERFKRVFYTPWFKPLVGHDEHTLLSQLEISDNMWKTRTLVRHGIKGLEEATYEITLTRKVEGYHAGKWMTESLIRADTDGVESLL